MSFELITDQKIRELIEMTKRVTNPTTRTNHKVGHDQKNYTLTSDDGEEFNLYLRQNTMEGMEDDFSCGLSWISETSEVLTLLRYNGSSHDHPNPMEKERTGFNCHIHKATEKYIKAGRKADGFAEATDRYSTLQGALHCLVNDTNITGLKTIPDEKKLF